jgi:hypothetical protein
VSTKVGKIFLEHWKISDAYIEEVMKYCRLVRLDIYGRPNEAVMERIQQAVEQGIAVTVTPEFVGFGRFK